LRCARRRWLVAQPGGLTLGFVGGPAAASMGGRSRLVVDEALKQDDGTYMCIASNPAGTRRAVAAVRVRGNSQPTHTHWRRGVVVSGVRRMNEVNARRARLVTGWVTVFGRVYHLGM